MALAVILGASAAAAKKRKNPKPKEKEEEFEDCKEFVRSLQGGNDQGVADSQLDVKVTPSEVKAVKSGGSFKANAETRWSFSDERSTTSVTRPHWGDMTKEEGAAVDEYMRKLEAHEDGHHDVARDYASKAGRKITGEGATPEEAISDLQEKLDAHKEEVGEGLASAREEYDTKTDHGRNQASVGGKNTTFTCPS